MEIMQKNKQNALKLYHSQENNFKKLPFVYARFTMRACEIINALGRTEIHS